MDMFYNSGKSLKRKVFYTGTDAIKKGQGLCYDKDYTSTATGETATDGCELRNHRVEVPSTTNNRRFAGVAVCAYEANALGQEIEIYEPGGLAEILIGQDATLPTSSATGTIMTCSCSATDAGRFTFAGFPGRGSARALETDASGAIFSSLDGSATAAHAASVTTITVTGVGTASTVGDRVVVLGGADDAAGGDATTGELATVGVYTVATTPTADTITIADDIGDVDVSFYILDSSEHTVLAELLDGEESGLQHFISPQDAVAVASTVGGVTYIAGGYTMAADSTFTLADGDTEGMRKAFVALGTLTTKDYVVTVTSGLQGDVSTALAALAFDAANEVASLKWHGNFGLATGGTWVIEQQAGVGIS